MSSLATVDIYQKTDVDATNDEKNELIELFQNSYKDVKIARANLPSTSSQGVATDVIKGKKKLLDDAITFLKSCLYIQVIQAKKDSVCLLLSI